MANNIVKSICKCLEMLVSEKNQDIAFSSKSKVDAFLEQLKISIDQVQVEVSLDPQLEQMLSSYIKKKLLCGIIKETYWNFLEWCLILIELLKDSLRNCCITKKLESSHNSCEVVLSVSQRKTVVKCLQFIVALGILPNLLPRVGQPLDERSKFSSVIESIDKKVLLQTKYRRLVTCVTVLLSCLMEETLQSIILTQHAGDLLAALFQLCYAPIKKIDGYNEESCLPYHLTSFENVNYFSYKNDLISILQKVKDESSIPDVELVHEMWQDREYFLQCLKYLLNKISLPVLIWELLLHRSSKKHFTGGQNKVRKAPLWLSKACSDLLIEKLIEPAGVKSFVHVMLDKVSDCDPEEKRLDKRKMEAVAWLVSEIPLSEAVLEHFIKSISVQVIDLLHTRGSKMDFKFGSIASIILLQFAQNHPILSEKYFFQTIFKAFWKCLDIKGVNTYEEHMTVVDEVDLTVCIEDAYQIFVENASAFNQNCDQLFPFVHLLFHIFSEVQNGVSYLRPMIFSLLVTVINKVDVEEAVSLMNFMCFEDHKVKRVHLVKGLKFVAGESGGITAVRRIQENPEEMLSRKYQGVNAVLYEASHKDLKIFMFLNLLKRLKDIIVKKEYKDDDLQNSILVLPLLQELAQDVGDGLVKKIADIIHFVKGFLDHGIETSSSENCLFGSETLVFALVILEACVGYKNQLSLSDWKSIKQCIPYLRKLSESSDEAVRGMSQNLITAIATHGHYDYQKVFTPQPCTETVVKGTLEGKKYVDKSPSAEKIQNCVIEEISSYPKGSKSLCVSEVKKNESFVIPNTKREFTVPKKLSNYQTALGEVGDPILPVRGHGLISLTHLIIKRDQETLSHEKELLEIFQLNIADEDSYIYLSAIQGLSALADVSTAHVLPILLNLFVNLEDHKSHLQMKVGEVLTKVSRNLGEMTVKYQNELINTFLYGIRNKNADIRMSSLSNLAEVCQQLKWSIQSMFYEILQGIDSVLKTDEDVGVRRSAAKVLTSMLKGMGKDNHLVMSGFMKELFSIIRSTYRNDKDEVVKLHAQIAVEEIRNMLHEATSSNKNLVKQIHVLNPL